MRSYVYGGLLALLFSFIIGADDAHARRGPALVQYGDHVIQMVDLPEEGAYRGMDLGWSHQWFAVFWMPLWSSGDGEYVLYRDTAEGFEYMPLSDVQAQRMARAYGVKLSEPGLLTRFWGWLPILGVIALAVVISLRRRRREASYAVA